MNYHFQFFMHSLQEWEDLVRQFALVFEKEASFHLGEVIHDHDPKL